MILCVILHIQTYWALLAMSYVVIAPTYIISNDHNMQARKRIPDHRIFTGLPVLVPRANRIQTAFLPLPSTLSFFFFFAFFFLATFSFFAFLSLAFFSFFAFLSFFFLSFLSFLSPVSVASAGKRNPQRVSPATHHGSDAIVVLEHAFNSGAVESSPPPGFPRYFRSSARVRGPKNPRFCSRPSTVWGFRGALRG